jgi:DNA-binding transcriptional LysR family regulator
VEEGFDIAIRVRERLDTDQDLVVQRLGVSKRILVADPVHLSKRAPVCAVADLPNGPLLVDRDEVINERWTLWHEDGEEAFVDFTPRLAFSDLQVLLEDRGPPAGTSELNCTISCQAIFTAQGLW